MHYSGSLLKWFYSKIRSKSLKKVINLGMESGVQKFNFITFIICIKSQQKDFYFKTFLQSLGPDQTQNGSSPQTPVQSVISFGGSKGKGAELLTWGGLSPLVTPTISKFLKIATNFIYFFKHNDFLEIPVKVQTNLCTSNFWSKSFI